jgi:hypothetical protein
LKNVRFGPAACRGLEIAAACRLEIPAHPPYLPLDPRTPGTPMARTNPLQFMQQVRGEVAKIHWPTRREVL